MPTELAAEVWIQHPCRTCKSDVFYAYHTLDFINAYIISKLNQVQFNMVHLISLQVDMQHVRKAYKIDSCNVTLKVMPGITRCHLDPNGFEKMRISYAFQLSGTKVLQAFHLYQDKLEATLGRMDVTQEFFR